MKDIIETIKNGHVITVEELFLLANHVSCTQVRLSSNGETIYAFHANRCSYEEFDGSFEFYQSGTLPSTCMYKVKMNDILTMDYEYDEKLDSIFVACSMSDGTMLDIQFWYVSEKLVLEDYAEMDLMELKEFLDETLAEKSGYSCAFVLMSDLYGMGAKFYTNHVFVDTLEDEWKLHVGDGVVACVEIPLIDDSVNEIYVKSEKNTKTILLKPFGQPFTQIEMLFIRK